jgi:hypothetical protein
VVLTGIEPKLAKAELTPVPPHTLEETVIKDMLRCVPSSYLKAEMDRREG